MTEEQIQNWRDENKGNYYGLDQHAVNDILYLLEKFQDNLQIAVDALTKIREITPYGMYHEIIDTALQQIQGKDEER